MKKTTRQEREDYKIMRRFKRLNQLVSSLDLRIKYSHPEGFTVRQVNRALVEVSKSPLLQQHIQSLRRAN